MSTTPHAIKSTAIQSPTGDNHTVVLRQLKEVAEIGQRQRGDPQDSFVRVSELVRLGIVRMVNNTLQAPSTLGTSGSTNVPIGRQVLTIDSIQGGGDLSADRTLSLVGDTASPGNNKFYGTDGSGTRGWFTPSSAVTPAALTKVDDTNVTLTLGGTPATSLLQAASLTLGWVSTLAKSRGGFGLDASSLTGYVKAAGAGAMSAASTIPYSDLTGTPSIPSVSPAALTKVDDTNVTLTLGGTPATSLLQATSITVNWTGTLAKTRGGFGLDASSLTGYVKAAGAGAMSASATIPYSDLTGAPSIPTVSDGVYTPTITHVTNVSASTASVCQYMRVGDTVTVSGIVNVTTIAGTTTRFGISLPVASSLTNKGQCIGYAGNADSLLDANGCTYGDVASDRAETQFLVSSAGSWDIAFHFTYRVV